MTSTLFNETDKNRRLFLKIQFLSDMSFDIAAYGQSEGILDFMERLDLTCGALPGGEYEQIIDPAAPEQFLLLYAHIAEHRFAFAVTELLKLSPLYIKPLEKYCQERGRMLQDGQNAEAAVFFEKVLLGGTCTGDDSSNTAWNADSKEKEFWEKCGGNVENYNRLMNEMWQGYRN